jgi:hypothetical protein
MRLTRLSLLSAALLVPAAPPSTAADIAVSRAVAAAPQVLPYPRSERAAAIWDERACWSDCGAHTAWRLTACVERDPQGHCLRVADSADRSCQRQCRTMGGPYVPDIFDTVD